MAAPAAWRRRGRRWAGASRRVAAIGISLGGMVACRAALEGAPIEELVLWSVPARGRTLLRELRAFSAFEVANIPDAEDSTTGEGAPGKGAMGGGALGEGAPDGEPIDDGTLTTNGYLMSAETVAALQGLDLAEVEPSAAGVRRALLLGRDGMKVSKGLPEALRSAGAEVTVADGPGYGAMMVETQDARTPDEVIEHVSSWLREGTPPQGVPIALSAPAPVRLPATATALGPAPRERGAADPSAPNGPSDHDEIVIHHAGVALRERPVFIERPDGRLFGVLTEPLGERRELTALLLNAGPQRRTGPNRMWVEIARRWAARGVPTLRLDADGIGDADGDAAALGRVTAFYRPVYVEQTRAALDALAERGLPQRFVVLGLCAGGYWSAQTALADERVAAVIMLNPRTLVFDEWRHTARRTRELGKRAAARLHLAQGAPRRAEAREAPGNGAHARRAGCERPGARRGADRRPPAREDGRARAGCARAGRRALRRAAGSRPARVAAVHRQGGAAPGADRERRARPDRPLAEPRDWRSAGPPPTPTRSPRCGCSGRSTRSSTGCSRTSSSGCPRLRVSDVGWCARLWLCVMYDHTHIYDHAYV